MNWFDVPVAGVSLTKGCCDVASRSRLCPATATAVDPVHSPPTDLRGSDDEDDPGANRGSPARGLRKEGCHPGVRYLGCRSGYVRYRHGDDSFGLDHGAGYGQEVANHPSRSSGPKGSATTVAG